MDGMTDEQRMLTESLDSILQGAKGHGEIWQQLAGSGMLGLTLPESAGGAGLGLPELLLFLRRMGRAGTASPYLASEVLAVPLLAGLHEHSRVQPLLQEIINGSQSATLATEDLAPVIAKQLHGGRWELDGAKMLVPAAAHADIVLLSASHDGEPMVFLLDPDADRITRTSYTPADPAMSGDLRLNKVSIPEAALLARGEPATRLLRDAQARGCLATCADMLGSMEMLLELTVDYLRTRQQFGQSLSSFQVLQHAAVDMYVELETARAMLEYGVRMFDADEAERSGGLSAVKVKLNSAAKIVGENAIQLHGGIGMTMESLAGRLFARLVAGRLAFGDTRHCLRQLMANEASVALS